MTLGIQLARADGGVELFNGTATVGETTIAVQTTQVQAASRLTSSVNRAIPIAGSTAMLLPLNGPGPITVGNYAATAVPLLVYPAWNDTTNLASGGKIQNGAGNAVFSVAQNKTATFYPMPNGLDWTVVLSA